MNNRPSNRRSRRHVRAVSAPSASRDRSSRRSDPRAWQLWRLMQVLRSDGNQTQRALSDTLGTALGLTNQLLQTVIQAGWVRVVPQAGHRVRYELTRKGRGSCASLAHLHVEGCAHSYEELRKHVDHKLSTLAGQNGSGPPRRIVLYGTGILAEIAYLCARRAGLTLVGVVDDPAIAFLPDVPCHPPDALSDGRLAGEAFDCIVILSPDGQDEIRARLRAGRIAPNRIASL